MTTLSRIDRLYRGILLSKYFTKGWGTPENLRELFEGRETFTNRDRCVALVDPNHPVIIDRREDLGSVIILDGHFESPFAENYPKIVPNSVRTAHFQMILPKKKLGSKLKPLVVHMAGTGDHLFWRRRILLGKPLAKENGVASILLENPYYGTRKPPYQKRSCLQNVSDLFVMGGSLMLESQVCCLRVLGALRTLRPRVFETLICL